MLILLFCFYRAVSLVRFRPQSGLRFVGSGSSIKFSFPRPRCAALGLAHTCTPLPRLFLGPQRQETVLPPRYLAPSGQGKQYSGKPGQTTPPTVTERCTSPGHHPGRRKCSSSTLLLCFVYAAAVIMIICLIIYMNDLASIWTLPVHCWNPRALMMPLFRKYLLNESISLLVTVNNVC